MIHTYDTYPCPYPGCQKTFSVGGVGACNEHKAWFAEQVAYCSDNLATMDCTDDATPIDDAYHFPIFPAGSEIGLTPEGGIWGIPGPDFVRWQRPDKTFDKEKVWRKIEAAIDADI